MNGCAGSDGIAIRYLGQCGFLLQRASLAVVIDPYLTDSVDRLNGFPKDFWKRAYPPPLAAAALRDVSLVLCTHAHLDHTDPETLRDIAAASPACLFAGPKESVAVMHRNGISAERTRVLNEGEPLRLGDLVVEPVAAAHEEYETDAEGHQRYLGYLLRWDGLTLFHSGDTLATQRLSQTLAREPIDVGFLPINGGDAARRKLGIGGNMNPVEAMALASERGFDLMVPMHHDLYFHNGASLADFAASWETVSTTSRPKFKAFLPGERAFYRKSDRLRPTAVILGAGKTGRGFLARLLAASRYQVAFVDQDEDLVRRLNADTGYTIHFFGGERAAFRVDGVSASLAGSEEALNRLVQADILFTAIGEQNVAGLDDTLRHALSRRRKEGAPKLSVVVCENGASPAAPLRQALVDWSQDVEISEAAIFCSTIELPGTRLDIQSEACDELPYDAERLPGFSKVPAMKATPDFPILLQRKIYTYNCFSACIAYLGAYKGYAWYADAAQDAEIGAVLDRVAGPLNEAIVKVFRVDVEEQHRFSEAALRKFRDQNIRDDIARNARDVIRKLAPGDRLVAPAQFILENGGEIQALALVMASALLYQGPREAALQAQLKIKSVAQVFFEISGCEPKGTINRNMVFYYQLLTDKKGRSLLEILAQADLIGGTLLG